MNANPEVLKHDIPTSPKREVDLPALVAISWSVAGGLLAGGATVATLILTSQMSGHMLIAASAVFYIVGALLGLAHGVMLGIFGRPEGVTPMQAARSMAHGIMFYVPALFLGWLVAGWVAALPIALIGGHVFGLIITLLAWMVMVAIVTVAISTGLKAARLAWARWPDRVPGVVGTGATFAALAVMFAVQRPTIWFTSIQMTGFGSIVFAYVLTFWFYGPLITIGLAMRRTLAARLPANRAASGPLWRRRTTAIAAVIGAGLLIVSLGVPFHEGVLNIPTAAARFGAWQAIALALSNAIADELLMRLFLFTAAFYLAARYLPRSTWSVGLAISVAALGDLFLHWPDLNAYGLPGTGVMIAYLVARVAMPAALFGYLYWKRGFGTALATHAAADVALGLMVL